MLIQDEAMELVSIECALHEREIFVGPEEEDEDVDGESAPRRRFRMLVGARGNTSKRILAEATIGAAAGEARLQLESQQVASIHTQRLAAVSLSGAPLPPRAAANTPVPNKPIKRGPP